MAVNKLGISAFLAVYFIPTIVLCNTTVAEAKPTDYHAAEDGVRDLLQRQFDEKVWNTLITLLTLYHSVHAVLVKNKK